MIRRHPQKLWSEVREGEALAPLRFPVDYARIILNAAATWDYFPGHHDPEYARSQGQPNIYASTILFHGLIDRFVTDWGGPLTLVRRRRMRMVASVYPGDLLTTEGRIVRCYREAELGLVDLDISLKTTRGLCVPASVCARLPLGHDDSLSQPTTTTP
ncbi:MaoC/PaaZ C-terminal domain-containing protein [Sinimarinibacterium flocculans]|uniref:MaoC/PaaZ C-terminal domain-containing protein n=1 Tax=Sinimarinibacterium flocculans TaxID=985250 RepID=UPI003514618B